MNFPIESIVLPVIWPKGNCFKDVSKPVRDGLVNIGSVAGIGIHGFYSCTLTPMSLCEVRAWVLLAVHFGENNVIGRQSGSKALIQKHVDSGEK